MRATIIEKGNLVLNLNAVLEHLSKAELMDLADHLSINDAVIKNVAAQILDGWTEGGSHGGRGWSEPPSSPLDCVIREVAGRSGDVAKKQIEDLSRRVQDLEKSLSDCRIDLFQSERKVTDLRIELRRFSDLLAPPPDSPTV